VGHKTCHFIFQHNSHISWWIFTLYIRVETGMNSLQNGYKIYRFTLTASSMWQLLYLISAVRMTAVDGFLQCVWSNWLCATFTEGHPMFAFTVLLVYSLVSLWAGNLLNTPAGFGHNFIFRTQHIPIFHFIALGLGYYYARCNSIKWTLQCDATMTSSVCKKITIVDYYFLFPLVQSYIIHQEILNSSSEN